MNETEITNLVKRIIKEEIQPKVALLVSHDLHITVSEIIKQKLDGIVQDAYKRGREDKEKEMLADVYASMMAGIRAGKI